MSSDLITAEEWFSGGTRSGYDPTVATLTDGASLRVFQRVRPGTDETAGGRWTTFLPGFPDGSYGYSQVDALLGDAVTPRLFVEYMGQGDSDKPRHYRYGVTERADLVEAHWRDRGIEHTTVVSFDYSSLVVLELLARHHERQAAGARSTTMIESVLLINGGLFADAHTHPWQATPMLKTVAGRAGMWATQRSPRIFAQVMRTANLFSSDYSVTSAELREEYTPSPATTARRFCTTQLDSSTNIGPTLTGGTWPGSTTCSQISSTSTSPAASTTPMNTGRSTLPARDSVSTASIFACSPAGT